MSNRPEPFIERPVAQWVEHRIQADAFTTEIIFKCSICGVRKPHSSIIQDRFCWNCGAYMRGYKHEEDTATFVSKERGKDC